MHVAGGSIFFNPTAQTFAKPKTGIKIVKSLFLIVFFAVFTLPVAAVQECIGINFFNPPDSYLQSYTCWGDGKSYVYRGSPATFVTCDGALPVDMSEGTGSLVLESTMPGGWWNLEFKLDWGHSVNFLRYGEEPLLHLRLRWGQIASGADMSIELIDDQAIWNLYRTYTGQGTLYSNQSASIVLSDYVTPSTSWQDVYIPMADFLDDNPNLDLTRISLLKFYGMGYYSSTNTLYIEKIKIIPGIGCEYSDMVKINQLGYLPNGKKLALVSYEDGAVQSAPTIFQVIDNETQGVAYQGSLQLKTPCSSSWDQSGDTVYHADFTSLTTPGSYVIYLPELGQTSLVFDISSKAYNEAFRDALRFFYFARSGNDIAEPYAEGHPRPTIYANNNVCEYDYDDNDSSKMYDYDPSDTGITTRDVQGGWFDAGDVHLDIHNNVTTLWFLLEMLEQQQEKLGPDILNLPESDGQTNDLVLLIKYQLDWFKKMQNTDGSVHFIVISELGVQNRQRVSDVSTGAACVLAGIFAKAYPLFSNISGMESYATDLLSRAELSWSWLMAHTSTYNPRGMDGNTWSYGITNDRTFRSFAAIELYIATGNSTYHNYFTSRYTSAVTSMQGISAIGKGHMDYAETTRPVNTTIKNQIRNAYIDAADNFVDNDDCSPYKIPMEWYNNLYWGSSGIIACNAYTLLRVYDWTDDTKYRDAALDALEWIGGRNPVSRIFITGYSDYQHGTDHYSFYMFDHLNPVPGYLCGNINCLGYGGGILLDYYVRYPWKYYLNIQNASILEPCLPWQSEMCYLLGYFASDLNLTADLYPDGIVNLLDLQVFSQAWLSTPSDSNWNEECNLAEPANIIDFLDFAVFAGQWMNQ